MGEGKNFINLEKCVTSCEIELGGDVQLLPQRQQLDVAEGSAWNPDQGAGCQAVHSVNMNIRILTRAGWSRAPALRLCIRLRVGINIIRRVVKKVPRWRGIAGLRVDRKAVNLSILVQL